MSESSDIRSNTNHEYMKEYDAVVGRYTDAGAVLRESIITNPERKEKIDKMFAMSAAMGGGLLLPGKGLKKSKTPKRKVKDRNGDATPLTPAETQFEVDNEPPHMPPKQGHTMGFLKTPVARKFVYLHNQLGKIKMAVEAVLESEMAFCLVFSGDDELIFVPNAAETLNFTNPEGETEQVYYANTLFTWIDGVKKLMILYKTNNDE